MTDIPPETPRWRPDPFARHEFRWWDGATWTEHVSDSGMTRRDLPTVSGVAPPRPGGIAGVGAWFDARSPGQIVALLLGAVVIGGFVISTVDQGGNGSPSGPDVADSSQVQEVCHNQVRDQLKAPSTADFGGDVVTGSEPEYQDSGWVDAENSFGAKIRTAYTCTARHTGGDNFSVRATLID